MPEPVQLLVAVNVVGDVLRDSSIKTAVCALGLVATLTIHYEIWAVVFAPLTILALVEGLRARRALRWLELPESTAERSGQSLVIRSPNGQLTVHANDYMMSMARRKALPTASTR